MHYLPQILFVIIAIAAFYFFGKKVAGIRRNVFLGREEDRTDRSGDRWRNVALLALGQQKMFKRPIPAIPGTLLCMPALYSSIWKYWKS